MKGKGATTLQLHHAHRPTLFLRRIPRGNTGKRDPLVRLRRMAEANAHHIRSMLSNTLPSKERDELRALRRQLISLLAQMSERPGETQTGTYDKIAGAMSEARVIYARVSKPDGRRRPKRTPEQKGVRAKNLLVEQEDRPEENGNDLDPEIEAIIQRSREPRPDPQAEAFWDSLLGVPPSK